MTPAPRCECFPTEEIARLAKRAITVAPRSRASECLGDRRRLVDGGGDGDGSFCLVGTHR